MWAQKLLNRRGFFGFFCKLLTIGAALTLDEQTRDCVSSSRKQVCLHWLIWPPGTCHILPVRPINQINPNWLPAGRAEEWARHAWFKIWQGTRTQSWEMRTRTDGPIRENGDESEDGEEEMERDGKMKRCIREGRRQISKGWLDVRPQIKSTRSSLSSEITMWEHAYSCVGYTPFPSISPFLQLHWRNIFHPLAQKITSFFSPWQATSFPPTRTILE